MYNVKQQDVLKKINNIDERHDEPGHAAKLVGLVEIETDILKSLES